MKSNVALLAVAKNQLGNGGAKYRKYVGKSGNYCNMFVYWLFNANGCASLFPLPATNYYRTYCPDSIKWCKKNLAEIPPYLAMASDIIYFDWEPNGKPNHIGIVDHKIDTSKIATIEGNTSGKINGKTVSGIVASKVRNTRYTTIFRPHFPHAFNDKRLAEDGDCQYQTIGGLQKTLKILGYYSGSIDCILGKETVRAIQRLVNCSQDGAFGPTTSGKFQQYLKNKGYYSGKVDKEFGKQSVIAMQRWINNNAYQQNPATKPTTSKPATTKTTYRIDVDITNQICTVYKNGKPIMSEFCSTARKGKTTPAGNFKISGASGGRKAKYRTARMQSGKSYAEFACRFKGAKMLHTVPYKKRQTTGHVNKSEFNKLGTPRSAGCVRLPWIMAHYIYTSCPVGTPVRVFKGKSGSYPMGKPKKYTATTDIDPTYKK